MRNSCKREFSQPSIGASVFPSTVYCEKHCTPLSEKKIGSAPDINSPTRRGVETDRNTYPDLNGHLVAHLAISHWMVEDLVVGHSL